MKNSKTGTKARASIMEGHRFADLGVDKAPGGRLRTSVDETTDGVLLHLGDDVVLAIHRSQLDRLLQGEVQALSDGSYRVTLTNLAVHVRLDAPELNAMLALRRDGASDLAAPVELAARAKPGRKPAATQAPTTGKAAGAKGRKAAKAPAPSKVPAQVAADSKPATETVAKARGRKKGAAPQPPAAENAPISLAERRGRKMASNKPVQTELPGMETQEPLRQAARSAMGDRRLKEVLPAEVPSAPKTGRRKATDAPTGRAKPTRGRSAARGAVAGKADTAKAPTGKARTAKSQAEGSHAELTGARAGTGTGTAEATPPKGRRGKAVADGGTKGSTTRGAGKATARGTGKATTGTAKAGRASAATGEAASVADVKASARKVILATGRPVPRKELLNLVQQDLGKPVPGRDPIENLATIVYKDKDKGFQLVRSRGFWVTDMDIPTA